MTTPWILAFCAMAALLLAVTVVLVGVLRQVLPVLEEFARHQRQAPREEGPPVGSPLNGLPTSDIPRGFLFLSAECRPCQKLIQELNDCEAAALSGLVVVADSAGLDLPPGLDLEVQADRRFARELHLSTTPYAIAVNADGTLAGKGVVNTVAQLQALIDRKEPQKMVT